MLGKWPRNGHVKMELQSDSQKKKIKKKLINVHQIDKWKKKFRK